ncbi:5-bromo-4-chloroindolyl phosphate hydrolysis family protein [Vaginisenegalia massiliensis]|uniref:5-bromo-4-chloroindolyl phosphate hydrolysis family protein n=1 Tax=Vaginisenegalia massiliensis TaxID=2058294 RepID=UPI000F5339DB|nr:5-bromo-4-chloroindolyl phosphate hydrolysis family protein [Vaginisenegalia massiliensis]
MSATKRMIIAIGVSLTSFLLGLLVLKWPIWLVMPVALGFYFGLSYILTPQFKVADVMAEHTALNEELNQLYLDSRQRLEQIATYQTAIEHEAIRQQIEQIHAVGQDILTHLSSHLQDLSSSRHFLEYYLPKTLSVLDNYNKLEDIHLSADKMVKVNDRTQRSLTLLSQIYQQQRDDYYQNTVSQLEVTNELLEKTVTFGRDMIQQEDSTK